MKLHTILVCTIYLIKYGSCNVHMFYKMVFSNKLDTYCFLTPVLINPMPLLYLLSIKGFVKINGISTMTILDRQKPVKYCWYH